jgi:hypothetical protein
LSNTADLCVWPVESQLEYADASNYPSKAQLLIDFLMQLWALAASVVSAATRR